MAKYTVQMTFEAPGLRGHVNKTFRLPGSEASMHLLGGDGMLAVSAAKVTAESPVDAAMAVMTAISSEWSKSQGPLKMLSWTANRDRVLVGGRSRAGGAGRGWDWDHFTHRPWDDDGDDPGGSAGVREPRRPKSGPPSLHLTREI